MTGLANRSFCFFCLRELKAGAGRYRFMQKGKEVECCPSCFDEKSAFSTDLFEESTEQQQPDEPETIF